MRQIVGSQEGHRGWAPWLAKCSQYAIHARLPVSHAHMVAAAQWRYGSLYPPWHDSLVCSGGFGCLTILTRAVATADIQALDFIHCSPPEAAGLPECSDGSSHTGPYARLRVPQLDETRVFLLGYSLGSIVVGCWLLGVIFL
jgi:hypothetical protein